MRKILFSFLSILLLLVTWCPAVPFAAWSLCPPSGIALCLGPASTISKKINSLKFSTFWGMMSCKSTRRHLALLNCRDYSFVVQSPPVTNLELLPLFCYTGQWLTWTYSLYACQLRYCFGYVPSYMLSRPVTDLELLLQLSWPMIDLELLHLFCYPGQCLIWSCSLCSAILANDWPVTAPSVPLSSPLTDLELLPLFCYPGQWLTSSCSLCSNDWPGAALSVLLSWLMTGL